MRPQERAETLAADDDPVNVLHGQDACRARPAIQRRQLTDEYEQLMTQIADYEGILASPQRQRQIVGQELAEIVARYGDDRRTQIIAYDGDVTNEDYASALVHFQNGARGLLESCRVINGAKCDMSFELHGTKGAVKWNFERMNELQLQFRRDDDLAQEGYTTVLSGPAHPYHRHFNPGPGISLGYDDLKVIEAYEFLSSIASGKQGEPGFREAAAVARVQQAIIRSWESKRWETVDKE